MPVEIREVVIKAQIEQKEQLGPPTKLKGSVSEAQLQQIKEELMERIEEKFWRLFNR